MNCTSAIPDRCCLTCSLRSPSRTLQHPQGICFSILHFLLRLPLCLVLNYSFFILTSVLLSLFTESTEIGIFLSFVATDISGPFTFSPSSLLSLKINHFSLFWPGMINNSLGTTVFSSDSRLFLKSQAQSRKSTLAEN